jgi:hypothetical protein
MNLVTIAKIYETSVIDHTNPYTAIDWADTVDRQSEWFMSPKLISLYGTEYYANLSEIQQKELSFWEAINFFTLNIHGEKALIQGLAARLYQDHGIAETGDIINKYIHIFLAEENQHMSYFGGFCNRYAKGLYPDKKIDFPADEYAPGEDDFLFFAKVLIFEETVDVYNRIMAKDMNLNPIARMINNIHHHEETRHLIFGRQVVETLFKQYSPAWSAETLAKIQKYITMYFSVTWAEYYNPDVYRDAGFDKPFEVRQAAYKNPINQKHRQEISSSCIRFFQNIGFLEKAPVL